METTRLIVPPGADPRDIILTAEDVHRYLRLGSTTGYKLTGGPLKPYQVAPGRSRLADIHRYQDDRLAGTVRTLPSTEVLSRLTIDDADQAEVLSRFATLRGQPAAKAVRASQHRGEFAAMAHALVRQAAGRR